MNDDTPAEERLAAILRAADPLPPEAELRGELRQALGRTRAAVRRVASAARSGPAAVYGTVEAPWGEVHVAVTERGLVAIELRTSGEAFAEQLAERLGGAAVPDQPGLYAPVRAMLRRAQAELREYLAGARTAFDLPLDLRDVSTFDRAVLEGARRLGFGQMSSYGRLAARIGRPRAARAVGGALGRNPIPIVIPCHRILAADGSLGGYGGGLDLKRALLRLEGVPLPYAFG